MSMRSSLTNLDQETVDRMGTEVEDRGKVFVHLLVCLFGITSWSIMNGLWVELPILVAYQPEGWTLPSYLTIIAQGGNLGPIVFSLLVYLYPKTKLETPTSVVIVIMLSIIALLYSFFWRQTVWIDSDEYSVPLLTLTLCQSIFAATSSMAYLAFMSHLKAQYMSSIFIGQGFSGLIPAFAAIGQGVGTVECVNSTAETTQLQTHMTTVPSTANTGYNLHETNRTILDRNNTISMVNEEPAFSVQGFFLMLFGLGIVSLFALLLLEYAPYCKSEHVDSDKEENCQLMGNRENESHSQTAKEETKHSDLELQRVQYNGKEHKLEEWTNEVEVRTNRTLSTSSSDERHENNQGKQLGKWESWYLLGLLAWINVLQTSYVLAIQVYSSLPYGLGIYNGATKAENIVDPIACFITLFVTAKTSRTISGLTLLGTLFTAYIIIVATMSPSPFLVHEEAGGILIIAAWVMCTLLMVYSKVSIAAVMRSQGRKSLIYTGATTQIGALIGSILAYVMINQLKLYKRGTWC